MGKEIQFLMLVPKDQNAIPFALILMQVSRDAVNVFKEYTGRELRRADLEGLGDFLLKEIQKIYSETLPKVLECPQFLQDIVLACLHHRAVLVAIRDFYLQSLLAQHAADVFIPPKECEIFRILSFYQKELSELFRSFARSIAGCALSDEDSSYFITRVESKIKAAVNSIQNNFPEEFCKYMHSFADADKKRFVGLVFELCAIELIIKAILEAKEKEGLT